MKAEILTIGDELCRGEIVDTNSTWLAARLWERDISADWLTSCRDLREDIEVAVRQATARSEVVLVSGGLGPTEDDLTVDALAGLTGVQACIDPPSLRQMEARYAKAGYRMTPSSRRQVRVPDGARVYPNPVGAAPGFEVAVAGVPVICMPGVPRELHAIYDSAVEARLIAQLQAAQGRTAARIAKRVFRVFGMGESQIADALEGLLEGVAGATLHYQVKYPETLVKVVIRRGSQDDARDALAAVEVDARERLGHRLYGVDGDTLAGVLQARLRAVGATVATAESCTGGLLGARITDSPGASAIFPGGAIAYSDQQKTQLLGVQAATLERFGAVSEECALEMAGGAQERFGSDYALAITGVAGPDGGTDDKPVGTVWLAAVGPGQARETRKLTWPATREQIRELSAYSAMALLLRLLEPQP